MLQGGKSTDSANHAKQINTDREKSSKITEGGGFRALGGKREIRLTEIKDQWYSIKKEWQLQP